MSLAKYLIRFITIDHKIRTRSSGTPKELAKTLNISESQLYDNIADLKIMGLPIEYDHIRRTYYYSRKFDINDFFENKQVAHVLR